MEPGTPTRTLRVLIVEDHAPTRLLLQQFFERRGHTVQIATSCREARERLREGGYDLLISDLGLPDGLGWEVLEDRQWETVPYAVAASGYGSKSDQARSRACGFQRHLVKPYTSAQLEQVLREATAWADQHHPVG